MNSRIENGTMTLPSKEAIIKEIHTWLDDHEIDFIDKETNSYISYSDFTGTTRTIYFPETDNVDRIKII